MEKPAFIDSPGGDGPTVGVIGPDIESGTHSNAQEISLLGPVSMKGKQSALSAPQC